MLAVTEAHASEFTSIALSEAYEQQRIKHGDWIVMAAFGAGFTWGSALLKWAIN